MSKELDMMSGLNSYDYGARQYYSVVPAWDSVDPLCEKYYNISPYVYCEDDPINAFDPDGKQKVKSIPKVEVRGGVYYVNGHIAGEKPLKSVDYNLIPALAIGRKLSILSGAFNALVGSVKSAVSPKSLGKEEKKLLK